MTLPETVSEHLDGEQPVAEVDLGGEDRLVVTPTRTLVYRADGLLSDETVEAFPHDAERITLTTSRRKAKLTLDYGLDGEETLSVPKAKIDEVLHPLLAGVLDANGITDPGETVKRTFRFSELTLIVTDKRVVKHIGQAVWDEEHEEYHYDNVTDLAFEPGNVATSVVITHDGRQERFKAPSDDARAVEAAITDALLSYHDLRDIDELRARAADEAPAADADAEPAEEPQTDDGSEWNAATDRMMEEVADESTVTSDGPASDEVDTAEYADTAELAAEIDDLREIVERQQVELERQNDLIEQLIEELRQGR